MTTVEMAELLGRTGTMPVGSTGDMTMSVLVIDVRTRFGRTDYRVMPLAGTGSAWVAETTVTLIEG